MSSPTDVPSDQRPARFGEVRWSKWLAIAPGLVLVAAILTEVGAGMVWAVTATAFAVRFLVECMWWDYRYGPPGNLLQRLFRL
jgi:hypothetical protein